MIPNPIQSKNSNLKQETSVSIKGAASPRGANDNLIVSEASQRKTNNF
jgi:hypothetical protein